METTYIERHLYDADGHTDYTYYIRIVRRGDSRIWNPTDKVLEAEEDITWDESYILLDEEGDTGVFPIVISHDWRTVEDIALEEYSKPLCDLSSAQRAAVGAIHQAIGNIPAGTYDVIVYKQLGSDPANSDDVVKQYETKMGDIFGF